MLALFACLAIVLLCIPRALSAYGTHVALWRRLATIRGILEGLFAYQAQMPVCVIPFAVLRPGATRDPDDPAYPDDLVRLRARVESMVVLRRSLCCGLHAS